MMTPKAPHHSTAWQPAAALQSTSARALRQGWALVAAAVLSACSSTPLPPWTTQPPSAAQPPAAAQARRPVPPPLGTAPRGEAPAAPVTITPIGPNAPEPSAAAPLPYGEAVAARFPDQIGRAHI